jgi:predicted PurR-regulated permease PerM
LTLLFVRRLLVLLIVASGGVLFSQAPEFAQQYRQRLGGAIDELTTIIQTFDEQANHAGFDRRAALNVYASSSEPFLHSQGEAMNRAFERYEALTDQLQDLAASPSILRPLVVLEHIDPAIFQNAWKNLVPAAPISFAGLVWTLVGMFMGSLIAILLSALLRAVAVLGRLGRRRGAADDLARTPGQRFS